MPVIKKVMLSIISFLFLVLNFSSTSFAQEYKVVWPQFGVVRCEVYYGSEPISETKSPICAGNSCTFTFSCEGKADCQISSTDIVLSCDSWGYCFEYTLTKDGQNMGTYSNCVGGRAPESITMFSNVVITGYCKLNVIGYPQAPLSSNSKITMYYKNIYLYDENPDWPEHMVEESVGCIPQGIMYKTGYVNQLPSFWVDSEGNIGGRKPTNLVDALPTNMKVGETYSYFYGWREVPGINVVMGKDGKPSGYCGGTLGRRKLISYTLISSEGINYLIPTSIQREVECCYNEDCKWKDPTGKLVCDPTTFTCTEQRPCNSDIDCQILGETYSCINKIETSWKCDLSKKWYPYEGTCIKSVKPVPCCNDNDCPDPNTQYCNREEGCKPKYLLVDCPTGKCCEAGSNYKYRECPTGLICCHEADPIIGECKQSCAEQSQPAEQNQLITGQFTSSLPFIGVNGIIVLTIIFITLIIIGIYLAWKRGIISIETVSKLEHPKKDIGSKEVSGEYKFCTNCGAKQKINNKFCTNCGEKLGGKK